ncbi:hypothetical protein RDWZM_009035 [Blomia tropicalis]|uniref:BZIP domain-containing protein n=1 Tax=Blomia tropicalis TaxID=40697 RepID=A0A9Q0M0L9_BLOTA|nr:hypothetical protein RDWZM_009035 [Blomia tropicalis]
MKNAMIGMDDPFLSDPSLMVVDPNHILDYGTSTQISSSKGTTKQIYQCNQTSPNIFFGVHVLDNLIDQSHYPEDINDFLNFNDSQLENIILSGELIGIEDGNSQSSFSELIKNDLGSEQLLDDLMHELNEAGIDNEYLQNETYKEKDYDDMTLLEALTEAKVDLDTCMVANYEEVSSIGANSNTVEPTMSTSKVEENSHKVKESKRSSLKRKLSCDCESDQTDSDGEYKPPSKSKSRLTRRRTKRVQNERVKNQNKVAALKYRQKKKDEIGSLDYRLSFEEERNQRLKSQVEEYTVNINVLKELLQKFLVENKK